jgi:transketolase
MSPACHKPMRDALIGTIYERMDENPDFFFLSADMGAPALDLLRRDFPDRVLNVGIAEQNMVNIAAGLAMEGFTVFTYAIASFYMRAIEQIRINLAISAQHRPMNVTMLALGGGLSYDVSGPTHHCLEDLSIMRALPNVATFSPADSVTALAILNQVPSLPCPKYLRLDGKLFAPLREGGPSAVDVRPGFAELRTGSQLCLVATGAMVPTALEVAARFPGQVGVVDVFRLDGGIDAPALGALLARHGQVVSLQEAFADRGGLDSLVAAVLDRHATPRPHHRLGMRPVFDDVPGSRAVLHTRNGLAPDQVADTVALALAPA